MNDFFSFLVEIMYIIDMKDLIPDREETERMVKESEDGIKSDRIMYWVYAIIIPPIFYFLKYVYSLLH